MLLYQRRLHGGLSTHLGLVFEYYFMFEILTKIIRIF